MRNFLIVSAAALSLGAPQQASKISLLATSSDSTCSGLHLTAYRDNTPQPALSACCDEQRHCPRYLSITPAPRPHRELKT
jgi:hypothetical protein